MSADNYGYIISTDRTPKQYDVGIRDRRYRNLQVFRTKKDAQKYLDSARKNMTSYRGRNARVVKATKAEYRSAVRGDTNDRGMTNFFSFFYR